MASPMWIRHHMAMSWYFTRIRPQMVSNLCLPSVVPMNELDEAMDEAELSRSCRSCSLQ